VWDGVLPAPKPYKEIASRMFDALRDEANVKRLLGLVYSSGKEAVLSRKFVREIIDSAAHPEGPNAYASIIFSPKANLGFGEALEKGVQNGISYLMVYGREDPWVVPLWGQRAYLRLRMAELQQHQNLQRSPDDLQRSRDVVNYCELTPAGHCPHHEAPRTVGKVTEGWIRNMEQQLTVEACGRSSRGRSMSSSSSEMNDDCDDLDRPSSFPPLHNKKGIMRERDGREVLVNPMDDKAPPRNPGEWIGTLFLRQRTQTTLSSNRHT